MEELTLKEVREMLLSFGSAHWISNVESITYIPGRKDICLANRSSKGTMHYSHSGEYHEEIYLVWKNEKGVNWRDIICASCEDRKFTFFYDIKARLTENQLKISFDCSFKITVSHGAWCEEFGYPLPGEKELSISLKKIEEVTKLKFNA